MSKYILKNLTLILSLLMLAVTLLAVMAPVFAYLKLNFLADPIYWIFQWFCHQRPWRSYHMFDYQYALDARMITTFLSLGIGGLIVHFTKLPPLKMKSLIALIIIMLIPMGVDGVIQMIAELSIINKVTELPFYESTNFIRSVTGIFAGTGMAFTLFPYINSQEAIKFNKKYLRGITLTFVLTFIFIPVFVFLWSITSTKYKPSSMFIDHTQRFPGYNYEITTEGGHSTIDRYLKGSTRLFEQRAKYFNKSEYLTGCAAKLETGCKTN